jgi:hypothetical protein
MSKQGWYNYSLILMISLSTFAKPGIQIGGHSHQILQLTAFSLLKVKSRCMVIYYIIYKYLIINTLHSNLKKRMC